MSVNYKQSQFELFPQVGNRTERVSTSRFFFSSITLSLENIIISGIVMLLVIVFSFAVGVEKGKRVVIHKEIETLPKRVSTDTTLTEALPATAVPVKTNVLIPFPRVSTTSIEVAKKTLPPKEGVADSHGITKEQEIATGHYTIQVASYARAQMAQKELDVIKKRGLEGFILTKGKYVIVCAGKFSRKDDAKLTLNRLQKTYKDCMIRRL